MKAKRSLYQCANARVLDKEIYCASGKLLGTSSRGKLGIEQLVRGRPLELAICQKCPDYDENGKPVPELERGWAHLLKK